MLMLFHPPTWKSNDAANPIPPSVSLIPYRWMNLKPLKNWERPCILLPPLALANQRIASLIFIAEVPLGEKNPTFSLSLSPYLSVSLNPLMVTLLDFRNLRPGVKMAASGESAHPSWQPQRWLQDHAKQTKCRRYENRTASQGLGSKYLSSATTKQKDLAGVGMPQAGRLIRQFTVCLSFCFERRAAGSTEYQNIGLSLFWLKLH